MKQDVWNEIFICSVNIKCPLVCPCEFDGFISTFLFTKSRGITCPQSTQTHDRCKVHFCPFGHGYLLPTIGSGTGGDPQTQRLWEEVDKRPQDLVLQMPSAFCRGKSPWVHRVLKFLTEMSTEERWEFYNPAFGSKKNSLPPYQEKETAAWSGRPGQAPC